MPRSNIQRITIPSLVGGVSTQPEGQRFPNQVSEAVNVNLDIVRGLEKRDGTVLAGMVSSTVNFDDVVSIHWFNRDEDEYYLILSTTDSSEPLRIYNVAEGCAPSTVTVDADVDLTYATGLNGLVNISDTSYMFNSTINVATDPSVPTVVNDQGNTVPAYSRDVNTTPQVNKWNLLDAPASIDPDFVYRYVLEDYPGHPAGFYVGVNTDPDALPQWERVQTPDPDSAYDPTTMPLRLRCTGKGLFTLDVPEWTPRLSGDSLTNPPATFTGQKITGLTFWSGRLWVQAGQNLVGSRANDLLNFWVNDEVAVNDADIIDLQVGSDTTLDITHVLPYSNTAVIFTTANRQFEITSGTSGLVSPSTVSLRESTAYPASTAQPVRLGNLLYFPTNGGGASRLYEYIVTDGTLPSSANDAVSHAYGYIPENVKQCVPISQSDQIFMLTEGSSDIYGYQQRWNGAEKVQSAVFKWTVHTEDDTVLSIDAIGSVLYILIARGGDNPSWRVEKIYTARSSDDVNQDGFDYPVSLDGKQLIEGTYDFTTGKTRWTSALLGEAFSVGFLGAEWSNMQVYSRQEKDYGAVDQSGTTIDVVMIDEDTIEASGNWIIHPVIFGRTVDMEVELSTLQVRDDQGLPVDGTLQLKRMNVHHRNTGYFRVGVTPPGRSEHYAEYTAKQVGLFNFLSNEDLIDGPGMFPFKVMSSAAGAEIKITSDNPSPVNIPYIEIFGGFVSSKSSTTNYR